MQTHGTALTDGQLAEFLGNGTRALALIASRLGPQHAHYWDGKSEEMQERLLKALTPTLLDPVGTVNVPATGQFVVRNMFARNTVANIRYIGYNFLAWFAPKVEEPIAGATLRYATLLEYSLDGPIMDELGDSKETTLAQIYALIEHQKDGKSGELLTNGYANIFYVHDAAGVLRAVFVRWFGGGWYVYAFSVSDPDGWFHGGRVFSRNS